jgi:hypothetical protein
MKGGSNTVSLSSGEDKSTIRAGSFMAFSRRYPQLLRAYVTIS